MELKSLFHEESLDDNELLAVFDSLDEKSSDRDPKWSKNQHQIQPYNPHILRNHKSNQTNTLIITEIPTSPPLPNSHSPNKFSSRRPLQQSTLNKKFYEPKHGKPQDPSSHIPEHCVPSRPQPHRRHHSSDSPPFKRGQFDDVLLSHSNANNKKQKKLHDAPGTSAGGTVDQESRDILRRTPFAKTNFNVGFNSPKNRSVKSPLIELPKSGREIVYASEKMELVSPLPHPPTMDLCRLSNGASNQDSDRHDCHLQQIVPCENEASSPQEPLWMNGISSSSKFKTTQKEAMEVLESGDYILMQGKPYIKKSGWRKIAFFFNLSFEIKDKKIEVDDKGNVLRSEFIVRAIMQNGRFAEAFGSCDRWEKRFNKPNHDIPTTAETRAKNRACQDLLGIGEYKSS